MPRGEPLGTPGGWPTFFSGKPAGGRIPEPAYIQERACGPGVWVAAIFHPRAQPDPGGPGPPCCMDFGSGKNGNAGFPKKKTGHFLGVWGETPGSPFAFFWGSGQKKVAAHSTPLSAGFRTLCADILKSRFSFRLCREAPPFFPQRKGGKKCQGVNPLEPRVAGRLSFQESRREGGYPNPPIYKKGAAAPYKYSADSGNRGMSTYNV